VASFKWFPPKPTTGETVSLVSSSTDPASPITGFEWSLSSIGAFSAGKPVLTTSFATPGGHVVRLRVTDAAGRSSIATQTVPVTARRRVLMQPFPIVRIAGSVTSRGARLRLLTVQAPIGTRVTVACRGPGCKTKSESRLATVSSKSKSRRTTGAVLLAFHRFERPLRAGAILRVLVSKSGEIGKYTSFVIRRHKLPLRKDACIAAASSKPTPCPTS
jgi:PKD domain.